MADEIELIKAHYGDFTGLYDPAQAVAHVRVLLAELDAIKKNRLISAIFGHHPGAPKPFALYRRADETGVSGTGVVALGAEFPDGMVVLRWTSAFPTSVVFHERGIESVEAIHGHGGKTQIVWLSDELESLAQAEQQIERLEAQRDEVLELCGDAAQVIGVRGFLAVDAIRAVFAASEDDQPRLLSVEGKDTSHG